MGGTDLDVSKSDICTFYHELETVEDSSGCDAPFISWTTQNGLSASSSHPMRSKNASTSEDDASGCIMATSPGSYLP